MPLELKTGARDFAGRFKAFLDAKRETDSDVAATVAKIIATVRKRGDAALVDYTRKFDRLKLDAKSLRLPESEIAGASNKIDKDLLAALKLAAKRIEAYHTRQKPKDTRVTDKAGVELGAQWRAVEAAGVYVPGGLASYPSSALMNTIPARVAGVERIAMMVPAPNGALNPLVLAAAEIAGVTEIYRIGGAQAIAALAYGTETIKPVDVVVGPGNAYVAEAKRQVYGVVGIDMIAGPSEIVVVADKDNDPDWIAADLLSQAEHDPAAQSILITDDATLARKVVKAVTAQLAKLPRAEIARASWKDHGAVILTRSLDEAPAVVDAIAPEHVELLVADPDAMLARIRNAGAAFLGPYTPEPIGDYVAGTNHVLPTGRRARFSSGLSVLDFMKRTSVVRCDPASFGAIGPAAQRLAHAEGLGAHAESIAKRLARRNAPSKGRSS
jgi:histidinol dehydrogenase